ncbi:MAG TPA: glycosyltransferase family 4 protein [Rhizomicrobium sp.]|jgi:glycosyltransferase involved in cell wall biosynthesis
MKIAIITPGGVDRSGVERIIPCLLWFIERLVKSGDEVHVFALRQQTEREQWPLLGATVHNAGGSNPLVRGSRTLLDLHHEHRRAPFDVIHALWAVPQGVWAAIAGKVLRVPVLLHLPGGDVVDLPEIKYGARSTCLGRMALRFAISGANRIVVPSHYMVRLARELGITAECIPFGVALDHWPIVAPRRRPDSAPARLLHVGNLSPVKDQEALLIAMHYLRERGTEFQLDIIGEDTLGGVIQRRTVELSLESRIGFHGFVSQSALRGYVRAADLLIVSSMHEAGPIVALEAAACGVPTVGTNVGLLADWAPDAACAVDVVNGEALGAAIADILSNENLRLELASEAQQRAVAENADVTTRKIRELYLEIIER